MNGNMPPERLEIIQRRRLRRSLRLFLSWLKTRLILGLQQRWIRFGLVGLAASASYFLLGLLFVNLWGLPTMAGNTLAYVLSFVVSYLGQSVWTFQSTDSHRDTLPKFAMAQVIGLAINSCVVKACMRLGYPVAMLMAIAVTPAAVYIICKYWVFPQKNTPPQG